MRINKAAIARIQTLFVWAAPALGFRRHRLHHMLLHLFSLPISADARFGNLILADYTLTPAWFRHNMFYFIDDFVLKYSLIWCRRFSAQGVSRCVDAGCVKPNQMGSFTIQFEGGGGVDGRLVCWGGILDLGIHLNWEENGAVSTILAKWRKYILRLLHGLMNKLLTVGKYIYFDIIIIKRKQDSSFFRIKTRTSSHILDNFSLRVSRMPVFHVILNRYKGTFIRNTNKRSAVLYCSDNFLRL